MESIDKIEGTFDKRYADASEKATVSSAVIRRLPRYHRYLGELMREGTMRISSAELSRIMEVTASQIRQDFNCFGGFGQQGYGYNVKYLYGKIGELLGISEGYRAVIVGAGNLGRALASSRMFMRRGVTCVGLFDINPELVGKSFAGIPVYHIDTLADFCRRENIAIGVLTVPKESAISVAETLSASGVKGIWNFANNELRPSGDTVVENVHLGDSLMTLCYAMKTAGEKNGGKV